MSHTILCILAAISPLCYATLDDSILHRPRRSLLFFPILPIPKHDTNNNYKPFSIFSRPPAHHKPDDNHPDKKPDSSGGFISHVGNVLHGGSIGIEIRPLAPLQGILDHAKKIIPGHGTGGRPNHEKPGGKPPHMERPDYPNKDHPHHERPNYERPHHERPNYERPHHERPQHERPNYERPEHERPHHERPHHERPQHERPQHERPIFERPHQQRPNYERPNKDVPNHERPNKDVPNHEQPAKDEPKYPPKPSDHQDDWEESKPQKKPAPQWEDIGEVSAALEDDYGDGILQPRGRRPKRFIESKIYHVPLMYRSNGRTDRVRFRSRNGLRKHSKDA